MIVVDDHVDSANMLAVLLRIRLDRCVLVAYDGGAAVALALAKQPAAVILDVDMPVLDGVQAARAIRQAGLLPMPLLIAVSGNIDSVANKRVFDWALSKPVDLPRLVELLA